MSRTPLVPPPAPQPTDYILDPAYSKRAWQLGYGGLEYGANQWGKYWENPKPIDHAIFDFSQAQLVNFESPDGYMCRLPTWVLKQLGAQTLEEAHTMVDDAEFIVFVGKPLIGAGEYMWTSYVESPKLKRAQAEADKRAAAIKAAQENRLSLVAPLAAGAS